MRPITRRRFIQYGLGMGGALAMPCAAQAAKGGKLERKQAKRVLKSIKEGVDLVEERCDNLQKQVEQSESGARA